MSLEVIATGVSRFTVRTVVLLETGVELHVPIQTPLVLEEASTVSAFKAQLVSMALLVNLQEAKP